MQEIEFIMKSEENVKFQKLCVASSILKIDVDKMKECNTCNTIECDQQQNLNYQKCSNICFMFMYIFRYRYLFIFLSKDKYNLINTDLAFIILPHGTQVVKLYFDPFVFFNTSSHKVCRKKLIMISDRQFLRLDVETVDQIS